MHCLVGKVALVYLQFVHPVFEWILMTNFLIHLL